MGSALCSDREPGSGVNRLRLRSKSEIGSLRHPLGKSLLLCGTVCSTLRPHRSKSWPVSVTNTSARVQRALAPPAARRAPAGARGASSSVLSQSSRYREVRILLLTPPGSRLSGREGLSGCGGGTRETGRARERPAEQSCGVAGRDAASRGTRGMRGRNSAGTAVRLHLEALSCSALPLGTGYFHSVSLVMDQDLVPLWRSYSSARWDHVLFA